MAEAQIALRALWRPGDSRPGDTPSDAAESAISESSMLRNAVRTEFQEALKASQARRLQRLENKINRLTHSSSGGEACTNGHSHAITPPVETGVDTSETGIQTSLTGETVPPDKLASAFEKAMVQAMKSARPPSKKYGKSSVRTKQVFQEPPEKDEKKERESTTMRLTLEAINPNNNSRQRQIASLKKQLAYTEKVSVKEVSKVNAAMEILQTLRTAPGSSNTVYADRLQKRKEKMEQLKNTLAGTKEDKVRNEDLARQQHAYLTQAELLYRKGLHDGIQKFPAGDIFLVPQPLPVEDDGAEVSDVGTSYANPYEVDSWPFQPNVLAGRASQDATMDTLREETEQDLEEASKEAKRFPMPSMSLNRSSHSGGTDSDDDDDDDYGGGSATARSV